MYFWYHWLGSASRKLHTLVCFFVSPFFYDGRQNSRKSFTQRKNSRSHVFQTHTGDVEFYEQQIFDSTLREAIAPAVPSISTVTMASSSNAKDPQVQDRHHHARMQRLGRKLHSAKRQLFLQAVGVVSSGITTPLFEDCFNCYANEEEVEIVFTPIENLQDDYDPDEDSLAQESEQEEEKVIEFEADNEHTAHEEPATAPDTPRQCRFGSVSVALYTMTLGDNPESGGVGPPVALGDYLSSQHFDSADDFRQAYPRAYTEHRSAKRLSRQEREAIVRIHHNADEICRVIRACFDTQLSRIRRKNEDPEQVLLEETQAEFKKWRPNTAESSPSKEKTSRFGFLYAFRAPLLKQPSTLTGITDPDDEDVDDLDTLEDIVDVNTLDAYEGDDNDDTSIVDTDSVQEGVKRRRVRKFLKRLRRIANLPLLESLSIKLFSERNSGVVSF